MNKPIIFAHRGSSVCEPENTMRAFVRAFHDGVDGIEFDVRSSLDGSIVVIHDHSINRTSNGSGIVNELTLEELRKYDFGMGETIPTLIEVLNKFGNKYWLNIEIKEKGFEKEINDLITDLKVHQKIVISSFNLENLKRIKESNSQLPTAYLYSFGKVNLEKLKASVNIDGIHPRKNAITKELLSNAHELSLAVRPWTVDNTLQAAKFARLGVDGIITNNPKRILDSIAKKMS